MTIQEKIEAGHDPKIKPALMTICKALQASQPDLLPVLEQIVDRHERATRQLYGLQSTVRHAQRDAYMKRFGR